MGAARERWLIQEHKQLGHRCRSDASGFGRQNSFYASAASALQRPPFRSLHQLQRQLLQRATVYALLQLRRRRLFGHSVQHGACSTPLNKPFYLVAHLTVSIVGLYKGSSSEKVRVLSEQDSARLQRARQTLVLPIRCLDTIGGAARHSSTAGHMSNPERDINGVALAGRGRRGRDRDGLNQDAGDFACVRIWPAKSVRRSRIRAGAGAGAGARAYTACTIVRGSHHRRDDSRAPSAKGPRDARPPRVHFDASVARRRPCDSRLQSRRVRAVRQGWIHGGPQRLLHDNLPVLAVLAKQSAAPSA